MTLPQGTHAILVQSGVGCGAVGRGSDVRAPPTEWLTVIKTSVYGLCNAPGGRWWVLAEVSAIRHTKGPFNMSLGVHE